MDKWVFDKSVADRFMEEARTNIPDYERVIQLCIDIAKEKRFQNKTIIDVGAALGYTVKRFVDNGFIYTEGVDNSEAMVNSEYNMAKGRIILSDKLPYIKYDMIIANWTLHFIKNRLEYIKSIYNGLNKNGVTIITDKTSQTDTIKTLYYDFKLHNNVPYEYVIKKEKSLRGYMDTYSAKWYLGVLESVGFSRVEIINASYGFVTFYCEK